VIFAYKQLFIVVEVNLEIYTAERTLSMVFGYLLLNSYNLPNIYLVKQALFWPNYIRWNFSV